MFLRVHRVVNLIRNRSTCCCKTASANSINFMQWVYSRAGMNYCFVESKNDHLRRALRLLCWLRGNLSFPRFRPASGRHRQTARGKQPDKRLFVDSDKAIMRPWVVQRLPGLQMSVWKKVTGCTAGCSLDFIRLMRPRRSRPNVMTLFKGKAAEAFWMSLKTLKWKRLVISFKGPLHRFLNLKIIYESSRVMSSLF